MTKVSTGSASVSGTVVVISTDPINREAVRALGAASGRTVVCARYMRDGDARGGWRLLTGDALYAEVPLPAATRRNVVDRGVRRARRGLSRLPAPVLRRIRRFAPRLPLGLLPGERGPGITPGILLVRRILAGPLSPACEVALVVAVDRNAAVGVWFALQERPEITGVLTVEAALRYLVLARSGGSEDLRWAHVVGGDEISLDVPGLPEVMTRRPAVIVAPSQSGGPDGSIIEAITASGAVAVVVHHGGDTSAIPFLSLSGDTIGVRLDSSSDEAGDPLSRLVGDISPEAVVLDDGNAALTDPRPRGTTCHIELVRMTTRPAEGPPVSVDEIVCHTPAEVGSALRARLGSTAVAAPRVAPRQLLIGPANYAGQGAAWASAVTAHIPDVLAVNLQVAKPAETFGFSADYAVPAPVWSRPAVRAALAVRAVMPATHVLLESLRPLVASSRDDESADGWDFDAGFDDACAIASSGRSTAVLLHGSETRRPAAHADRYPCSPFTAPEHAGERERLERATERVHGLLARWDGPVFVSTLDLLDDVPDATWLPVVVGPDLFRPAPPLFRGGRPVVVHAPSSSLLKGSAWVDPLLERLDDEGLITYRRLSGVPAAYVGDFIREADVVVDQVVLGNPGVLAAQALAAGRLVVAHLLPHVRERFPLPVPVVEGTSADLEDVIRAVSADTDSYAAVAAQGPAFARELHDGRRSAAVLASWLSGA